MKDSFGCRALLKCGDRDLKIARLDSMESQGCNVSRLPFSLRILLENLLRREDGVVVTAEDIEAVANWNAQATPTREISFRPARVLLQDFTGVPAVVDLAAMRDAIVRMSGDPKKINPLLPVELVIDHSVQVDEYGSAAAFLINAEKELERNRERYGFLRWGQRAFDNFKVVPPDTGIVHQVNLEYLARVVMVTSESEAYPDTLVGTDSHTTMINGLGVLGWGVGGIEAEAAMLGQPISMLLPQVVGFKINGQLPEGATATDLVLTVTEMLRAKGVVGKFVEFFGPGLATLPLADRATIANMAPEYGATCGIFPVDQLTIDYLRFTGRTEAQVQVVEAYTKEQGLFHSPSTSDADYTDTLELDLSTVKPSLAGPKRPQDRIQLEEVQRSFQSTLSQYRDAQDSGGGVATETATSVRTKLKGQAFDLKDGAVVIAAITSCTNTSNPSVMVAAGLLAKKAVERGLKTQPWVKTSLAPGSKVVTDYLNEANLMTPLESLGFHLVGYGCTTCIGNSGPLPEPIAQSIDQGDMVVTSVLSGNRNFEGRVHQKTRANYLASPPLVVAYALAGTVDIDLVSDSLGTDSQGAPVYLRDIWPTRLEVEETIQKSLHSKMFESSYSNVFDGDEQWNALEIPEGDTYAWDEDSTYVKHPPYFVDMPEQAPEVGDITSARVLALLGDSITTDHISPAGAIAPESPGGLYLTTKGVSRVDFNTYGSRRGNHEIMMRGTFANIRLRNKMVPGVEGGYTLLLPEGKQVSIYDAAMSYRDQGVALVVLAGKEYGSGSSRDWAAKGPCLLGIRAVIAESYERIHRSNLIGMGILPLEFIDGQSADSLGLNGHEEISIVGLRDAIANGFRDGRHLSVVARKPDGAEVEFQTLSRIDTPQEVLYYQNGGILHYVLRQLGTG